MNETTTIQLPSFLDPDLCCDPFKTHPSQGLKPLQGSGTCAPVVAPNQRKPTLFANAGVLTATIYVATYCKPPFQAPGHVKEKTR